MSKQTNCTANWLLRGQSCYLCSKIIRPLNPKSYDPNPKCWKSMFRVQWQTVEPSLSLRKSLRRSRSAFLAPDPDRPPHFSPSKLQRFAALDESTFCPDIFYCCRLFRYLPQWTQVEGPQVQWRRRRTQPGWARTKTMTVRPSSRSSWWASWENWNLN